MLIAWVGGRLLGDGLVRNGALGCVGTYVFGSGLMFAAPGEWTLAKVGSVALEYRLELDEGKAYLHGRERRVGQTWYSRVKSQV